MESTIIPTVLVASDIAELLSINTKLPKSVISKFKVAFSPLLQQSLWLIDAGRSASL